MGRITAAAIFVRPVRAVARICISGMIVVSCCPKVALLWRLWYFMIPSPGTAKLGRVKQMQELSSYIAFIGE